MTTILAKILIILFLVLTLISLCDLIGIKGDKLSALSLSAIIISLINPYYLFSVGFILSYVTYLSLLLLTQPIKLLFSKVLPENVANYLAPFSAAYITLVVSIPRSVETAPSGMAIP